MVKLKTNEIIIRVTPAIKRDIVTLSQTLRITQTDLVLGELEKIYKELGL